MGMAKSVGLAILILSATVALSAGEGGLAARLRESGGELDEARDRAAAELRRGGIAMPEALNGAIDALIERARGAAGRLAEGEDPENLRTARKAWDSVRFARGLLRRIRHQHAEALDRPGPREEHPAHWRKMLDLAAQALHARLEGQVVPAMKAEARVEMMRLELEQQRARARLNAELAEIRERAERHRGDPRVAAALEELQERFTALVKTQAVRYESRRKLAGLQAHMRILDATAREHHQVLDTAERETEALREAIERLFGRTERAIDQRREAGEEDEEWERERGEEEEREREADEEGEWEREGDEERERKGKAEL